MADTVQIGQGVISVAGEVVVRAAEAALIAQFPFLGVWPFSYFWEFFFEKLVGFASKEFEMRFATVVIKITDDSQGKAAADSAAELARVQNARDVTPQEVQNARDNFAKTYAIAGRTRVSTPMP